ERAGGGYGGRAHPLLCTTRLRSADAIARSRSRSPGLRYAQDFRAARRMLCARARGMKLPLLATPTDELPSGIRRAAAPSPPRPVALPRPCPPLSWDDFERETPVERISALLVARARETHPEIDELPTRDLLLPNVGPRRFFDEPIRAQMPTLPVDPLPPS